MRNRALVVLTLAAAAFAPLVEGGTTHLAVFLIRVVVAGMLAVFIAGGARRGEIVLYRTPLDLPVALFILASLVSAFIAPYKYMAFVWLQLVFNYALYFYLARAAMADGRALRHAVTLVLFMGAFEAAAGLYQWHAGAGRAGGTFFNPNMLAGYMVPAVTLSLGTLVAGGRGGGGGGGGLLPKAVMLLVAALCAAVLVLTGSRGGALSLAAGLFVVLWLRSRKAALLAALILAVVLLAVPNPVSRRAFSADPFAYSRLQIWRSAVERMLDHPLGVGLGQFKYTSRAYNFPVEGAVIRYGKTARTAHNEYLHIGAETGFFGLGVFLFGAALLAAALARSLGRVFDPARRGVLAGLAGGITGVLAHSLVDSNLHEPGIVVLLVLLVCMALSTAEGAEGAGADARVVEIGPRERPRLYVLTGLLVLCMLAWAAGPPAAYYFSREAGHALEEGRVDDALEAADRALMFEPGNAAYRDTRAEALTAAYRAGMGPRLLDEAEGELSLAARLNPLEPRYRLRLARLYDGRCLGLRDPGARAACYRKALGELLAAGRLDPYDAWTMYETARTYEALGEPGRAVSTLVRLKGLEPNFLRGRHMLAQLYKDTGKSGLALDECYSIMKTSEGLSGIVPGSREEAFTYVDEEKVRELVRQTGGVI